MSNRIRKIGAVGPRGPIQEVRGSTGPRGVRLSRLQTVLYMTWRSGQLPGHLDAFLSSEFGKKLENGRVKLSPQTKRDIVSRIPAAQVEALLGSRSRPGLRAPSVVASQAAFFMVAFDPVLAGTQLDTLAARGKLKPAVRQQLFEAINHPNPLVGRSIIETLLLEPDNFWLAESILNENWKTFEAINAAWNESMQENADASKRQAQEDAVEDEEERQAAQAAEAQRSAANQTALRQQAQAQAFKRAQQKAALRHRWTTERPVTSDVAATPSASNAVGSAPAGVGMRTVKSVQDGHVVVSHQYYTAPGSQAAHTSQNPDSMPQNPGAVAVASVLAQHAVAAVVAQQIAFSALTTLARMAPLTLSGAFDAPSPRVGARIANGPRQAWYSRY